jgi:hypothetical protein
LIEKDTEPFSTNKFMKYFFSFVKFMQGEQLVSL